MTINEEYKKKTQEWFEYVFEYQVFKNVSCLLSVSTNIRH